MKMKTKKIVLLSSDKAKSYKRIIDTAGNSVKLAANLGYKAGYNLAKHPGLEKTAITVKKNYKASLFTLAGLGLGFLGVIGY